MLLAYSCENLSADTSEVWKLFFETYHVLDIQTTLQKSHFKNVWWNYNTNESCRSYLGNKEQKWLFLLEKIVRVEVNLSSFEYKEKFDYSTRTGTNFSTNQKYSPGNWLASVKKVFVFN